MIGGKIFSTKFPEGRIEITDVDHIAGSVVDFKRIAHPIWPPHKNINPPDKTGHRSLDRKADDDRENADRNERGVPVHKDDRERNDCDKHRYDQTDNALESEARGSVGHAADGVN